MPSKKRKYEARFPPARIKKIMQTDEEIGKVAAAVPVIISRSLEIFLQSLVERTARYTVERKAKTMTTSHLKHCIEHEHQFDFLKDLVDTIADVSNQEEEESGEPGEPKQRRPKRPRVATSDGQLPSHQQTRRRRKKESSTEDDESDEEGGAPSDQDDMPDWSVEQTRSSAIASNHAKKPVGHFAESTSKLNDWEQSNSNAVSHTVPSRMGFPMALQPSSAGDVEDDDYDT